MSQSLYPVRPSNYPWTSAMAAEWQVLWLRRTHPGRWCATLPEPSHLTDPTCGPDLHTWPARPTCGNGYGTNGLKLVALRATITAAKQDDRLRRIRGIQDTWWHAGTESYIYGEWLNKIRELCKLRKTKSMTKSNTKMIKFKNDDLCVV